MEEVALSTGKISHFQIDNTAIEDNSGENELQECTLISSGELLVTSTAAEAGV